MFSNLTFAGLAKITSRPLSGITGPAMIGPKTAEHLPTRNLGAKTSAAWATLSHWSAVRRERRALLGLDERMLKDIGISRSEAWQEARRAAYDTRPTATRRSRRFGV